MERAVWADSSAVERQAALRDLADGRVQVVFSVDLFNEGVDVPVVDTLLLLCPTDSPVLFLQQLGRGLRRAPGKSVCTVLDFVGHDRKEFRFDRRFGALLGGTRKDIRQQVEQGFPSCPPAATWSSTHWPPKSSCAPSVSRCRAGGPPRSTSCGPWWRRDGR